MIGILNTTKTDGTAVKKNTSQVFFHFRLKTIVRSIRPHILYSIINPETSET